MTNILNPAPYRDCIVSHHAQRIGTMYYVQWTMPSTGTGHEYGIFQEESFGQPTLYQMPVLIHTGI